MLRFLILSTKVILLGIVISFFAIAYLFYYYSKDLPDYSQLKEYHPPLVTRMYSAEGKLIEEYAKEHRIFVPITSVPKSLVEAFVAAEDKNFYGHSGIDVFSIIRAAITNISHIINKQRVEGGSTITQQVVKNFLLTSERSIGRKVKEAILSYRVSQVFTKDQILELYLNQIYLGKGAYGVAAAALNYFNKSVEELTISESAMLASLPKAPSQFNPERNYERALLRRNYVIGRMYDDNYITEEQARSEIALPIKLVKPDKVQTMDADYYAEQVREEVIGMFGEEYFYTAGLTIITCADSKLQTHAANALRYGIKKYDMKRGYRGPIKNIKLTNWQDDIKLILEPEGIRGYELAVVLDVQNTEATIGLKTSGKTAVINIKDMQWTRTNLKSIKEILKPGDVIVASFEDKKYVLQQIPVINGGIMVIDHLTGRVLAAEGGYDFNNSKFDRTTHAKRQPGSLIKPFVYLSALEKGAKPNDIFEDSPIELPQGPGMPIWKPKNDKSDFLGPITMRKGLERSRNLVTIRVGQFAGLNKIAETIKKFGINDNPSKVPSMVLGSLETTLDRMTIAYSIIANKGRAVEAHYIELIKDRKGNVIYKRDYTECPECKVSDNNDNIFPPKIIFPDKPMIIDEATSYQITSLLMGGVERGTSRGVQVLKKIIAGKTGTTNDSKDTWFVGFTPFITVGTYIGYDSPKTLGKTAYGSTIALPIFVEFMSKAYTNIPSIDFEVPKSIKLVSIDYETGKPAIGKGSIIEAFKVNNNPLVERVEGGDENKDYDPFAKIQDRDHSQEVY